MKRLAFHLPALRYHHYFEVMRGIHDYIQEKPDWELEQLSKYDLSRQTQLHFNPKENAPSLQQGRKKLLAQDYDALITYAHYPHESETLDQIKVPLILVAPDLIASQHLSIREDPRYTATLIVDHLVEAGYHSLTMLNQDYAQSAHRSCIFQELKRLTDHHNRTFIELSHVSFVADFQSSISSCKDRSLYLFFSPDRMEYAIHQSQQLKLRIPQEIGFACLYHMDQRLITTPSITHIQYDRFTMGQSAARLITQWAESGLRPAQPELETSQRLVIQESSQLSPKVDPDIEKAIMYIKATYQDAIKVEDILEQANISQKTLERKFIEHTGITPKEYLIQYRLEVLSSLLKTTKHSMPVLAAHCGFNDPRYMSRAFKQRFHVSPREYRSSKD